MLYTISNHFIHMKNQISASSRTKRALFLQLLLHQQSHFTVSKGFWDCLATFSRSLIFKWNTVLHKQGLRPGGPRRNRKEFLSHEQRGPDISLGAPRNNASMLVWMSRWLWWWGLSLGDWLRPAGCGVVVPGQHHLWWHRPVHLLTGSPGQVSVQL